MQIPSKFSPAWRDVITGQVEHEFEFLAVRILLGRLRMFGGYEESPEAMEKCVDELRELFERSSKVPSAQRDLVKIFGEKVLG